MSVVLMESEREQNTNAKLNANVNAKMNVKVTWQLSASVAKSFWESTSYACPLLKQLSASKLFH